MFPLPNRASSVRAPGLSRSIPMFSMLGAAVACVGGLRTLLGVPSPCFPCSAIRCRRCRLLTYYYYYRICVSQYRSKKCATGYSGERTRSSAVTDLASTSRARSQTRTANSALKREGGAVARNYQGGSPAGLLLVSGAPESTPHSAHPEAAFFFSQSRKASNARPNLCPCPPLITDYYYTHDKPPERTLP